MTTDAVLLHEHDGQQLVQVKAQQFVIESVLDELRRAGLVRKVRHLAPVLPVLSRRDTRVPFTTCAEMLRHDTGRGTPLWQLAVEYEKAQAAPACSLMPYFCHTAHLPIA